MSDITYIDYYIPKEKLAIADFLDNINIASIPKSFKGKREYGDFIESVLKLKSIRVESQLDEAKMLGGLVERMFTSQVVKPENIDIIILVRPVLPHRQVNLAQYLQHRYKMSKAYIVNVSGNHCADAEVALNLADLLIKDGDHLKNILILGSAKIHTLDKRVFSTYGILGDSAGLMLVNNSGSGKIKLVDNEIICRGMLHDVDLNRDNSLIHSKYYAKCIVDLLKKNSLDNSKIKRIIIQNANPLMIYQIIASRSLDSSKIFSDNLSKYGHMSCMDFVINLKDLTDSEAFNNNDSILSFGTGYAGTYISCLFSIG